MLTTAFLNRKYRYQFLATLTIHVMTLSHGIGIGWVSPTLQLLQSPDTPLKFIINVTESSWIGSVFGVGALLGNIIFGIILDRIGRKWCMYLLAIPHMLLWILIYFAQNVVYLYVARIMGGVTSGAIYVVMPIYLSEISDKSIRGALSSMSMLFLSFGILFGYIMASQVTYFLVPCIIIALPIIFLICACMFPETPQYLLRKGRVDEAKQSYKFYSNITTDTYEKTCVEFEELRETILKGTHSEPVRFKDFLTKTAMMSFLTALVLIFLNQFSSCYALINYMSLIFYKSGTTMDFNTCTIIIGVVQIVGTCLATVLVDRYGRKPLMLVSSIFMAVGMTGFGLFTQFASADNLTQLNWVPLAFMTFIVLIASVGVIALVFTIIVEILPAKIRSTATSICMGSMSVMIFAALKVYPYFIYTFGLAATMYSCSAVCIGSVIYLYVFLPETKGKSMDHD